jgi:hypothetical protein
MLEFPTPKQSVSHSLPEQQDNQLLLHEIAHLGDFPTVVGHIPQSRAPSTGNHLCRKLLIRQSDAPGKEGRAMLAMEIEEMRKRCTALSLPFT